MTMSPLARRTLTLSALALGAVAASAVPAAAQQAAGRTNVAEKTPSSGAADSVSAVEAYSHAIGVAQYGRQTGSPLALATAAQMLMDIGARPLGATPTHEAAPADATARAKRDAAPITPVALLGEARELAAGNEPALALIGQLDARARSGSRGAVGGPQSATSRVEARSTDTWRIRFRGGEDAVIIVRGDGDTDLDCWVYDEHDNLIDSDTDDTDICYLEWRPRWTGEFRLRIRNYGSVYNRYEIATN